MKTITIISLAAILTLSGCTAKSTGEQPSEVRTNVTITHAREGALDNQIELQGITTYLETASVSVPIAAYITKLYVHTGMRVRAGQVIALYESKEQNALGGDERSLGITPQRLPIRTSRSGIITAVAAMEGNYVSEGTPLCTVVETGSFAFLLEVPSEQRKYVRTGLACTVLLPDGTRLAGTVSHPMITMDAHSQSEQYVVRAKAPFLPEGMNVKVLLPNPHRLSAHTFVLPKRAVQSNETLTQYWVMRLHNNSTAERVDVGVGSSNDENTEVVSPRLSPTDRIILDGGYDLEDGAKVKITNP